MEGRPEVSWHKRVGNKSYWWVPGGEIQYGHLSGSLVIRFRGKTYRARRPNYRRFERKMEQHADSK